MKPNRAPLLIGVTALLVASVACGAPPPAAAAGEYRAAITAVDFPTSTTIDNPYLPLVPGTRHVYEGTSGDRQEKIVTEVTRETRTIMGILTVVVHDYVTLDGTLVEDTYDWFAQDKDGNVWYFGEATSALDPTTGALTNTAGAWEAGVDGAQPGIVMLARPTVGESYRQEYYKGEAEDQADVIRTGESVTTKAGTFPDTVRIKDYSALETAVVEEKLYARGVGFVFVEHVKGKPERIELVAIEQF